MSNCAVRSIFRSLIAVAVGVICTAALTIGLTIWWLHAEAIADAFRDSSNLAVVLAGQTASSIQSIDLILTEIKVEEELRSTQGSDELDRVGRGEATYQYLVERLSHLPQADFITLVDKNGKLVNTTLQRPAPEIDLSDRAYFQHFNNHDDKGIYIGNALINRRRNAIRLFSRRIKDGDNAFLGVVSVGVRLDLFPKQSMNPSHRCPISRFCCSIATAPSSCVTPIRSLVFDERFRQNLPGIGLSAQGGGNYRSPGYLIAKFVWLLYVRCATIPLSSMSAYRKPRRSRLGVFRQSISAPAHCFVCSSLFLLRAQSKQFNRLRNSRGDTGRKSQVNCNACQGDGRCRSE